MARVTRQDIIAAAIELFNTNSYHATSMQDIARAVAIKKPSLYHHFESKEAILLAILESGMNRLITDLEQIVESDQDPEAKLRAAVQSHARTIAANPTGAAVFMREDRGLGSEYTDKYLAWRDQFERLFRLIVQEGIDSQAFRKTDVAITVHGLLGMVNWMTRWYRPDGRLSPDEIATLFADTILIGICNDTHDAR